MKYIIFVLLIFSTSICLASQKINEKPSKLQKEFLKTTGLTLGNYISESNSDGCDSGKLSITDYGDELYLMYAGRSLVVAIGKEKAEEVYSECKRTFKSTFSQNRIQEISEEVCGKDKTLVTTTVNVENKKFAYSTSVIINGGAPEVMSCTAKAKSSF